MFIYLFHVIAARETKKRINQLEKLEAAKAA